MLSIHTICQDHLYHLFNSSGMLSVVLCLHSFPKISVLTPTNVKDWPEEEWEFFYFFKFTFRNKKVRGKQGLFLSISSPISLFLCRFGRIFLFSCMQLNFKIEIHFQVFSRTMLQANVCINYI